MTKLAKAALVVTTLILLEIPLCRADPFTVTLVRFGTCLGSCEVVIADNGPLDLNPAPEIIDFSIPQVGQLPDGVFKASGRAIETLTHNASGKVTGILMTLTNSAVQGLAGGVGSPPVIPGEIGMISSVPLVTLDGVSGFASLSGQYQNFTGGNITSATLSVQSLLDGCTVGLAQGGTVSNVPSPSPFANFNARTCPVPGPFDNLFFVNANFDVAAGDGFILPMSAEGFAQPEPEPSTLILFSFGLVAVCTYSCKLRAGRTRRELRAA
jgi:hypothetical protein